MPLLDSSIILIGYSDFTSKANCEKHKSAAYESPKTLNLRAWQATFTDSFGNTLLKFMCSVYFIFSRSVNLIFAILVQ